IGRIAGMNRIESARKENAPREQRLPEERADVFEQVPGGAGRFERHRMAINRDALEALGASIVTLADRADDRHLVPGTAQRRRLLPYTPVERNREIFDDDEDAPPTRRCHDSVRYYGCAAPARSRSAFGRRAGA